MELTRIQQIKADKDRIETWCSTSWMPCATYFDGDDKSVIEANYNGDFRVFWWTHAKANELVYEGRNLTMAIIEARRYTKDKITKQ